LSSNFGTLGSRGYIFLIDTDGSWRSRVTEENYIARLDFRRFPEQRLVIEPRRKPVNPASPRTISIDKKKISSGTQGTISVLLTGMRRYLPADVVLKYNISRKPS